MTSRTFKETLEQFGIDPEKIVDERKELIRATHETAFEGVSQILLQTLNYCQAKGIGNGGKLFVLQGAVEAGLYAMAISCTYPPDLKPGSTVPFESVLFAALLTAVCSERADGAPNNLQAAHVMFERLTGRSFRDCFIDNCGCKHCKARRKRHGIKLNPDRTDKGL